MTIGDVIDWVPRLVYNLQKKPRLLMTSSKIKNNVINQLTLSRRHTLESFKVLSCLQPEKLRSILKCQKIGL